MTNMETNMASQAPNHHSLLSNDNTIHWNDSNIESFPAYFIENIDNFMVRLDKQTLSNYLADFPLDSLKEVRSRLSSEFLKRIAYGTVNYVLVGRTSQATITLDIFFLMQFIGNKDAFPPHEIFSKVYKIKPDKHNQNESPELNEFFQAQAKSIAEITAQLKNLTETTNRILHENQNISKENKELKSVIQDLISQSKTTTKTSNTFAFPQPSPLLPPSQKTRDYASVLTSHPPTPSRQKRTFESDGTEVSKAKTPRTQNTLKKFDSSQPHLENRDLNDNDGFSLKVKRRTKATDFIKKLGTAINSAPSSLRIRPRKQLVFLSQCEVGTTIEDIENFLKTFVYKEKQLSFSDVKPAPIRSKKYNAFHFEIDYLDREVVRDKNLWPMGLLVDYSHPQRAPTQDSTRHHSTNQQ